MGNRDYQIYYDHILTYGTVSTPRGLKVTHLKDQAFGFMPGDLYRGPKTNLAIGFIELLQFITGQFSIEPFQKLAPNAQLELFTGQSAYGPRVVGQWERVIKELLGDEDTRRAVLMIAHPDDTSETLPCTLSMQFQLDRAPDEGKLLLNTIVTMRSSDLVWGLPTDMIQFGGVAMMIANLVGAYSGLCTINAGNAHIYDNTKLAPKEQFIDYGFFAMPDLKTFAEYQTWAQDSLDMVMVGGASLLKAIMQISRTRESSI